MYKLVEGAPEDISSRAEREQRCYRLLDENHIPYLRVDHPATDTMEACLTIDHDLGATICKNLFLCDRQEQHFYLLMIPGDKVFHTRDLSKQLGVARLSFAKSAYMEQFLDLFPGSVSILGLMNDRENRVRLLADRELLAGEFIGCHPCVNTSSLRLRTADMFGPLLKLMHHDVTYVDLPRTPDLPHLAE